MEPERPQQGPRAVSPALAPQGPTASNRTPRPPLPATRHVRGSAWVLSSASATSPPLGVRLPEGGRCSWGKLRIPAPYSRSLALLLPTIRARTLRGLRAQRPHLCPVDSDARCRPVPTAGVTSVQPLVAQTWTARTSAQVGRPAGQRP